MKIAKVVGLNSDQEVALTLVCHISESNLSGYDLFIIVAARLDDAFTETRQALAEAESTFYSSDSLIPERLLETSKIIQQNLKDAEDLGVLLIASKKDETSGRTLYLLCQGSRITAQLIRGENVCDLCALSEPGQLVSGFIEKGDRVVIFTESLREILGVNFSQLYKLPVENIEDDVLDKMPKDKIYPAAGIILEEEREKNVEFTMYNVQKEKKVRLPKLPNFLSLFHVLQTKKSIPIIFIVLTVMIGLSYSFYHRYKQDLEVKKVSVDSNIQQELAEKSVELPVWLDLNLVKNDLTVKSLSFSLGKILILDNNSKVLVSLDTSNKSHQIISGRDKLGEALLFSLNGGIAAVLSDDKGIFTIDLGSNSLSKVIEKDNEWEQISDLSMYGGNIYLLDKDSSSSGRIWKYVPTTSGYSEKRNYLKESVKVSFQDVIKMQIDSSIWILKTSGEIIKYTQGAPDFFSIGGLDKGIKNPKSFYVSDKTDNLYLLDSGNNRLVVFDKKGSFVEQYLSDKFNVFSDLVVDEEDKKVYLLEGSKIFLLELK